jgi:uncharacterized membrane protein ArfC
MRDLNGWLMALCFLLGLLLTLAMMVRRVTREVPVTPAGPPAPISTTTPTTTPKTVAQPVHKAEQSLTSAAADPRAKTDHILQREPYGPGSVRVPARAAAPAGYTIKGDRDTGRYFTLDSPDYAVIEAEVWFADEDSAAKAGFLRWDAKGDGKTSPADGAAAAVITEEHVTADIVIRQSPAPAEASMVIVDTGSAEVDSTLRFVSGSEDDKPPHG